MRINQGDVVKHFKGKYYKVLIFAKHSETLEESVVYQNLHAPFDVWVRPLEAFLEPVDGIKYPEASQVFRFEKIMPKDVVL